MSIYAATQQKPQTANRLDEAAPHCLQGKGRTETEGTMAMKNVFQTIRRWQRGNSAAKLLNRLDDRMLDDIGLARGDISKTVHIPH
jgi:uncharacterized protein YjiS (DUF1127 family)